MALNTVSIPFGYYPDPTKGRPVFNGSIYIGEPDLDPTILANQKTITIRQEGVDTPSVAQPIATSAGGIPTYNGSPAEILVDGSYSMAVLNSLGAQVYYVASQNDASTLANTDQRYGPIFATVAAMTAANPVSIDGVVVSLTAGMSVYVQGEGDYLVSSSSNSGYGEEPLDNGLYAQPQYNKNGPSLTVINPEINHISTEANNLVQSLNTVITGDSLSFNAIDYPAGWLADINVNATDNPFGISSWAHMIRDTMLASQPSFRSIRDLKWFCDSDTAPAAPDSTEVENLGLNAKAIKFGFANLTDKLIVETNFTGLNALIVSLAPTSALAVKFDVDGVEHNNLTADGDYRGYGYKFIPLTSNSPVINDVKRHSDDNPGGELWVYGSVSQSTGGSLTPVPKLTGKGGWTSAQILADYATRVKPYLPDVVYYMIGANDIGLGVPVSTFKSNVQAFIDLVYLDKPNAHIVLISTPPTSSHTDATSRPYIEAMRDLAITNNCSVIDLVNEMKDIDPTVYRFDNIHFNRYGDDLVYNIVKKFTLPTVPQINSQFIENREVFTGLDGTDMKREDETISLTVGMAATTPQLNSSSNPNFLACCSALYESPAGFNQAKIKFPYGWEIGAVTGLHLNGADLTDRIVFRANTSTREPTVFRLAGGVNATIDGSGNFVVLTAIRTKTEL